MQMSRLMFCSQNLMDYNYYLKVKIVTSLPPWSYSGSPFCHFFFVHLLHQSVTNHFLQSYLPPSLLLLYNIHYHFLSNTSPHVFQSLTLSSLVTPSTLLRNIISHACILHLCLLCIVHVSHPQIRVGTTIALNCGPHLSFGYRLSSTSFLMHPTTFTAAPTHCSISSSHIPI